MIFACLPMLALEVVTDGKRTYYLEGDTVVGFKDAVSPKAHRRLADSNTKDKLLIKAFERKKTVDSVGPLLGSIQFNQSYPYNKYCPSIGSTRCPAGCVAVAMAQIMMFYKQPTDPCHGQVEYKSNTVNMTIRDTFEGWIPDWEHIRNSYLTGEYTNEEADAVSELCRKLGVSVNMDYNRDGSGTQSVRVPNALREYFNYDSDEMTAKLGDGQWNAMLKENLDRGEPVYYASLDANQGGHAYVCDGYYIKEGEEAYPYYHFNFGWGGKSDGWFRLNSILITETGDEFDEDNMNFTSHQEAIINVRPRLGSGLYGQVKRSEEKAQKRIISGLLYIERKGKVYNLLGSEVF